MPGISCIGKGAGQVFAAQDPCDPVESDLHEWGVEIKCVTVGDREQIESLSLSGFLFQGSLSKLAEFNFTMMESFKVRDTRLRGSLPLSLRSGTLKTLSFESNVNITGRIPESWAGSFPALESLHMGPSQWQGTLPESWGLNTSFPSLNWMKIQGPGQLQAGSESLGLTGPIPEVWSSPGSFPSLVVCQLAC